MPEKVAISLRNVSKAYKRYHRPVDRLKEILLPGKSRAEEFWALRDISLEICKGETFGIIGRNGAGKSTLLQLIAKTLEPTIGDIKVNGRVAALLELGSGFNPEFTGRENVFFNGCVLGFSQQEIANLYEEIVAFADIGEFIDQPVKTYSSGMFVRLAFAVQAHIKASIVIIDEALSVGDIFFRQKCYTRLEELRNAGSAILLVTHSMSDIEQYCQRALLLNKGECQFIGPADEATKHYYLLHQRQNQPILETVSNNKPASRVTPKASKSFVFDLPPESFLDIADKKQIGTGEAICTRVAILDSQGAPRNNFKQGDKAVFCYEFQLKRNIGVPICGITIMNEKGVIVYSKNSWQSSDEFSVEYSDKTFVSCSQEIKLDIAPGEYIFYAGLAGVSEHVWKNRKFISFYEEATYHKRICTIQSVGSFSIGLAMRNGIPFLTHHGLVNLPSKITMAMHT